jgi:hypothetical protein
MKCEISQLITPTGFTSQLQVMDVIVDKPFRLSMVLLCEMAALWKLHINSSEEKQKSA